MANTMKLLGQVNPSSTAAVAGFTTSPVASSKTNIVTEVVVCNNSTSLMQFSIYHDAGGETWDTTNALFYDVDIPAKTTITLKVKWFFVATDSIGVQNNSESSSELVFSIYGVDQDV